MINQKRIYLALGLFAFGFTSCNSNNGQLSFTNQSANNVPSVPAQTVASAAVITTVANTQDQAVAHPPTRLGNLMNMNAAKSFSAAGSGLNPAHGMPGHDCAVAVGAPLPGRTVSAPIQATTAPLATTTPNFNANLTVNPAHGQPGHDCAVAVGAPLPNAVSSTPNINPAHGQPGHDCAVAVGAPLTGSPALAQTAAVPSALTNISSSPAQLTTPNFGTNLTVNPAHGQPGHDCAIAVGAPLTGASTATPAAPSLTTPNFNIPGSTNPSATINPAHGQPGHDCSVAVGAPLPS